MTKTIGLHIPITVFHWRKSKQKLKQDKILEAETESKIIEEYCLPLCSVICENRPI